MVPLGHPVSQPAPTPTPALAGDACLSGACTGTAKVCNDSDACTADARAKANGNCAFAPIAGCGGNGNCNFQCNDNNNPCTSDSYVLGKCARGLVTIVPMVSRPPWAWTA